MLIAEYIIPDYVIFPVLWYRLEGALSNPRRIRAAQGCSSTFGPTLFSTDISMRRCNSRLQQCSCRQISYKYAISGRSLFSNSLLVPQSPYTHQRLDDHENEELRRDNLAFVEQCALSDTRNYEMDTKSFEAGRWRGWYSEALEVCRTGWSNCSITLTGQSQNQDNASCQHCRQECKHHSERRCLWSKNTNLYVRRKVK